MTKQDEEFLNRVAKEAPELLDADTNEQRFESVVGRMLKTPPIEPSNRKKKPRSKKISGAHQE